MRATNEYAMSDMKKIVLGPDVARERIDKAIVATQHELTRQRIQALIKDGAVQINGVQAKSPSQKVSAGDIIELQIPEPEPYELLAENIPLTILYEDEHVIVVDKPAGLVVHPAPGNWGGTLVNALLYHCGDQLRGIGGVQRPGIVHRLDKETSGVMIAAKSDKASQSLTRQFADHTIERTYKAIVWGRPTPLVGIIDKPIGRHPHNRTKMAVVSSSAGKQAKTHYKVIKTYAEKSRSPASLVECKLETGRTHQVRVHMSQMGHALVGDPVYGGRRKLEIPDLGAFARQALHAASLVFEHPVTFKRLKYESEPPNDMQELISFLETQ